MHTTNMRAISLLPSSNLWIKLKSDRADIFQSEFSKIHKMANQLISVSQNFISHMNSSKKRPANILESKDVQAKRFRNAGLAYTGRNGIHHPNKPGPSVDKVCGIKCNKRGCLFALETKKALFDKFYQCGDWNLQSTFLAKCIVETPVARRRGSENSKRNVTTKYYFPLESLLIETCKTSFLNVFQITKARIVTVKKKIWDGDLIQMDLRGHHANRPKKISEEVRIAIREHINRFPSYLSHYSRKAGAIERRYLSPDLSILRMLNNFADEHPEIRDAIKLRNAYTEEFHKLKCRIGLPRSDTCAKCDILFIEMQNDNPELRKIAEEEKKAHLIQSDGSYAQMSLDIQQSKNRPNLIVLCVDLQQVLFCPTLTHSNVFYQRQYSSYNFCIYDCKNDHGVMCFWHESEGHRGSLDIMSCIYEYCREKFAPLQNGETRDLIVWSDRCGGQNNNYLSLCVYKYLVHLGLFTSVEQKFLISGHTFLNCDRLFALIEKRKRVTNAFVPEDWIRILLDSQPSRPFEILRMTRERFRTLDDLLNIMPKPRTLKVSTIVLARIEKENLGGILTKESHVNPMPYSFHQMYASGQPRIPFSRRTHWNENCLRGFELRSKYSVPIPISEEKKQNLRDMSKYLLPQYKTFYTSL